MQEKGQYIAVIQNICLRLEVESNISRGAPRRLHDAHDEEHFDQLQAKAQTRLRIRGQAAFTKKQYKNIAVTGR